MTSRLSAASEFRESAESAPTPRIADEGPYARPGSVPPARGVDAVLIDAIRASVGPFVPAPWRTASAASSEATTSEATTSEPSELPWIESFLDTAEGATDVAAEASYPEAVSDGIDVTPEEPISAPTPESIVEGASMPSVADEWPFEEAGLAMRELADDLVGREDTPTQSAVESESAAPDAPAEASMPPLRMWSEDDMMDIMPVKTSVASTENGEQWAARARRETNGAGSPESAAQALEALARRVRNGEIQLPAFSAEMGEAAALSAALAGLLSARR